MQVFPPGRTLRTIQKSNAYCIRAGVPTWLVCVRCVTRCVRPARVEALGGDEGGEFLCALHDPSLKAAVAQWATQQGL